jgi:predicted naringenin-chalcone synthase
MSWNIADQGFVMILSPRVPITMRRNIKGVIEHLLAPNHLALSDMPYEVG